MSHSFWKIPHTKIISVTLTASSWLCLSLISLGGCHLISSPDPVTLELQEGSSSKAGGRDQMRCQVQPEAREASQTLFTTWWEGAWELDPTSLSEQLSLELEHDPELIGVSIASAFRLRVRAQQAELVTDGRSLRLATTPLPDQRGARLVGAQREVLIWCEGDRVYWRVESGERFLLRRAKKNS